MSFSFIFIHNPIRGVLKGKDNALSENPVGLSIEQMESHVLHKQACGELLGEW